MTSLKGVEISDEGRSRPSDPKGEVRPGEEEKSPKSLRESVNKLPHTNSNPEPLIVTAFLTNINQRKDRSGNDYLKYGQSLLSTPYPKRVYIDINVYDRIKTSSYPKTTFIPIFYKDLYLSAYFEKLTQMNSVLRNLEKDTVEYMALMCNKTEFIRRAILETQNKHQQYIWIDFGIRSIFKSDSEFETAIKSFQHSYGKIRIGSIWNLNYSFEHLYTRVAWYFAGGVFGGPGKLLIEFADETKKECFNTITKFKKLLWEVNMWYFVYLRKKEWFDPYQCDHNASLILNY